MTIPRITRTTITTNRKNNVSKTKSEVSGYSSHQVLSNASKWTGTTPKLFKQQTESDDVLVCAC